MYEIYIMIDTSADGGRGGSVTAGAGPVARIGAGEGTAGVVDDPHVEHGRLDPQGAAGATVADGGATQLEVAGVVGVGRLPAQVVVAVPDRQVAGDVDHVVHGLARLEDVHHRLQGLRGRLVDQRLGIHDVELAAVPAVLGVLVVGHPAHAVADVDVAGRPGLGRGAETGGVGPLVVIHQLHGLGPLLGRGGVVGRGGDLVPPPGVVAPAPAGTAVIAAVIHAGITTRGRRDRARHRGLGEPTTAPR